MLMFGRFDQITKPGFGWCVWVVLQARLPAVDVSSAQVSERDSHSSPVCTAISSLSFVWVPISSLELAVVSKGYGPTIAYFRVSFLASLATSGSVWGRFLSWSIARSRLARNQHRPSITSGSLFRFDCMVTTQSAMLSFPNFRVYRCSRRRSSVGVALFAASRRPEWAAFGKERSCSYVLNIVQFTDVEAAHLVRR